MKVVERLVRHEKVFATLWRAKIERYLWRANRRFLHERGHKMAVFANDFIAVKVFTEGYFERDQLEALDVFLERLLGPARSTLNVLDIGANIGNHALFFARRFRRVFAFEPHPATFQLLAFNAQFVPTISAFNLGLSDLEAVLDLHEDPLNLGASSAMRPHGADARAVTIKVQRLDDATQDFGDVGLMKIDVEGMEQQVLRGASNFVAKQQPVIVLEQLAQEFDGQGPESPAIEILREWGYQFCWLEKKRRRVNWLTLGVPRLIELFRGRDVEYVFVTASRVPRATYDMLVAVPAHLQSRL